MGICKQEYDFKSNQIYYENSDGYRYKREYDSKGNIIYFDSFDGWWVKQEYDSKGNRIYYEDSDGDIVNYPSEPIPEYTMEELQLMLGKEFKIKK